MATIHQPVTVTMDVSNVCRVCIREQGPFYNVFSLPKEAHVLEDIYRLYDVTIDLNDKLSKVMCNLCLVRIQSWRDLVREIASNQEIQDYFFKKLPDSSFPEDTSGTSQDLSKSQQLSIVETSVPEENQVVDNSKKQETANLEKKESKDLEKKKIKALNVNCLVCNQGATFANKKSTYSRRELKKLFCAKHRQPFACPVKDCSMLFPFKPVFIHHYRKHLGLDKNSFLCNTCFEVLDSPRHTKKEGSHVCQNMRKLLVCCSESFSEMIDFVFHKLNKHCATVAIIRSPQQAKDLQHTPKNQISVVLPGPSSLKKDNNLFTCLVPHCDKVFNEKRINLKHFKEHSNIHSNVCGVCLCVCALQDCVSLGGKCKHKNQKIFCTPCNQHFQTLEKFALHKLYNHGSIITCGSYTNNGCPICGSIFEKDSDIDTRSHYKECYKTISNTENKPLLSTIKTELPEISLKLENKKNMAGTLKCIQCELHFSFLNSYVTHVKKIHNTKVVKKEENIKLCPICDNNYFKDDYTNHINLCTRSMKLSDSTFGCVYCKLIFYGMTDGQYRIHFMFCKSFQKIIQNNSVVYYKCNNCTFMSNDLEHSTSHAVTYCIFKQLFMTYAKEPNESEKIKAPKRNPYCSNEAPSPLINKYEYMCKNCNQGFYNEYIFKEHLQQSSGNCRPNNLIFCQTCQLDFDGELEFQNHCTPPPPGIPFDKNSKPRAVKQELDEEVLTYQLVCKPEPKTEEPDINESEPSCSYTNTYENQFPANDGVMILEAYTLKQED